MFLHLADRLRTSRRSILGTRVADRLPGLPRNTDHAHHMPPRCPRFVAIRGFDARMLMWLLVVVFATGLPLMVRFDADPARHAAALAHPAWQALRTLHAAASLALVVGTLAHVALRFGTGSDKGLRSGSVALAAIAIATITGALSAQTGDADRVAQSIGMAEAPTVAAAVVHIAYATIFVLLTVYFHVARWGWAHVFGKRGQAVWAVAVTGGVGIVLPVALPGGTGGGATFYLVPPWAGVALWTLLVSMALYVAGRMGNRKKRPDAEHTHE